MKLTQNKQNSINSILQHGHVAQKDYFVVFTASRFSYLILCANSTMVSTNRGKEPHTCKELIRRIMTFEYGKLLLLKLSQNITKVASNIVISGKKEKQVISRYIIHFEVKLLILQMSQQLNVTFHLQKILPQMMTIMMIANNF